MMIKNDYKYTKNENKKSAGKASILRWDAVCSPWA